MNYSGSYRLLSRNAKAAMLAEIEIYNVLEIDDACLRDRVVHDSEAALVEESGSRCHDRCRVSG